RRARTHLDRDAIDRDCARRKHRRRHVGCRQCHVLRFVITERRAINLGPNGAGQVPIRRSNFHSHLAFSPVSITPPAPCSTTFPPPHPPPYAILPHRCPKAPPAPRSRPAP